MIPILADDLPDADADLATSELTDEEVRKILISWFKEEEPKK